MVWVGLAFAGAGAIAGGITGGISFSQAKDLRGQCPGDQCPPDLEDDVDQMMLLANVSNAMFGVAGAGAIVAIIGLAITDWSPTPTEAATLHLTVSPTGAHLRGRF